MDLKVMILSANFSQTGKYKSPATPFLTPLANYFIVG